MRALCNGLLISTLLLFPALLKGQSSDDCLMCHGDASLTTTRNGGEVQLYVDRDTFGHSAHGSLECVDCHQGFDPTEIPHAKKIQPVQCSTCHDTETYDKSVHGRMFGGEGCKDCHGKHDILPASDPDSRVNRNHLVSTCGACHSDEDERYSRSKHGVALATGAEAAPSCVDCHGSHGIIPVSDPKSVLYKTKEPAVCLKCHIDDAAVRKKVGIAAGFIKGYEESVHGVKLAQGDLKAASCSDCHGAHDMMLGSDQNSQVNKFKIPDTCGRCHGDIVKTYSESIHGKALKEGNREAPNCTDCHGEHEIFAPEDPRSTVSGQNVSARVCARCHNSVALSEKYGLASGRFTSFEDSYHGLASKEGSVQVANCASCHGFHDIKPSSDPASSIYKANLPATCGKCHQGANENFTRGEVHVVLAATTEPILYWVRALYLGLIAVVIGGMFVHNSFDFFHKSRLRLAMRRGLVAMEHFGAGRYLRMSLSERIQHATLAASFIVLVITGFMLKYPDAWWVVPVRDLSGRLFEIRGLTHRIAGVVLIAVSVYHLYYISFVSRGKKLIRDMLPRLGDVVEFFGMFRYYLGLSKTKPKLGRFAYMEKAEYWALIWGVIVMGATGIMLWFNNYFIGLLTLKGWNVAQAVHYYEAWLATLAIIVWHFYFVIFNPSVYPLNTACVNGVLTEEEMAEEHPRELEEIRSAEIREEIPEVRERETTQIDV